MAEQRTYSIKIDGIEQSVKGVESLGENVSKTGNAWREAQKALREVKAEMVSLDKNSAQWKQLAKVAGDYKDRLDDINQAASRFASDTKGLDDAINIGQSMTSVFTLAQGAMAEFGGSTEDVVKSIQKLQGAMAIIQSLQSLQNTLKGSSATATLYTKAMNLLSVAMGNGSKASKILRASMLAIPLMLVIAGVTELILHWDELVGWFTKTFPALKNLSTWFNKVKGAIAGVGNAVWAAIKSFGSLGDMMKAIFSGHWDEAVNIAKNNIKNITDAFETGYADKMNEIQEEITLKQTEEENKRTKHNLEMLKAQKGNQAKFSKEGIALQKKDFAERKKLAKGNKDELNKIAVEEATFYREMQENKTAAAKKSAAERAKLAKQAADEQKKRDEEEKKRLKELNDANRDYNQERTNQEKQLVKDQIRTQEELVKIYESGPIEAYEEAVNKLEALKISLITLDRQSAFLDSIHDLIEQFGIGDESLKSIIDTVILKLRNMVVTTDDVKNAFQDLTKNMGEKELLQFTTLIQRMIRTTAEFDTEQNKVADNTKKNIKEVKDSLKNDLINKAKDDIENLTLKYERESDKTSEAALELITQLEMAWDNYLEHVKQVYGEDSTEFIKAQQEKQNALGKKGFNNQSPINPSESKTKQDNKNGMSLLGGIDDTNWKALWDPSGETWQNIAKINDLLFENVFDPINEAFQTMLEFQIEEAQEALDEATEMHDKSVEKVEESQDRINELNEKIKNSSGAQLEQYKQQQADEMLLMAQREAEERRLQREKEKREKELEKKQKQQKKLDLQMSLISGIANTAESVTKALTWGWPLGVIFAAIVGAMGAVQTAIIAKQMSKLADGGLLSGKSHAQGGIPVGNTGIEVEGGEYVVNKRSTAKYLPLLQALNEEGARRKTVANQLGKMANGGQLNYERITSNMNSVDTNKVIERTISSIDMHPQVSVVDINRGQKNLTQVRQMAGGRA